MLGSPSANFTGSINGEGGSATTDPILIPNGFPFSTERESAIYVSISDYKPVISPSPIALATMEPSNIYLSVLSNVWRLLRAN